MGKKRLSQGLRKYVRRQKLIIKSSTESNEEKRRLTRELLDKLYRPIL